ncbi:hypothetical protein HAX54_031687, partial [Datura stramonium]|nr:hypothetical protein [Datura stramonium]
KYHISTSLRSRIKNYEGVNLVVDLNYEVNKPEREMEVNSDDEVAESLIEAFASNQIQDIETEIQEDEQDSTANNYLNEVVHKEGLSLARRGTSRHK